MLSRIHVQGFRAVRDLAIDLRPFQVLIGENNAGKSSLLDALLCLQRVSALPLGQALDGPRFGIGRNLFAGDPAPEMGWRVTDEGGRALGLSVGRLNDGPVIVKEETLYAGTTPVYRRSWSATEGKWTSDWGSDPGPDQVLFRVPRSNGAQLAEALAGIRSYRLDPRAMARPAGADEWLDEDGHGFPGFLDRFHNREPDRFEEMERRLRGLFPRLRFVRTPVGSGGRREIAIREHGLSSPVFGSQASGGLMLAIGYLALALSGAEAPTIMLLDEPEMGFHMRRSPFVVDLLRDLSRGAFGRPVQVMVTTHSPDVVDFLNPEEVLVVEREPESGARAQWLDAAPGLKERLRVFNLGEYWSTYGEEGLLRGGDQT